MTRCTGRGGLDGDHCCYLDGEVCPFLEEATIPGRRFVCGLRRQLGSWSAVGRDPRYRPVGDHWVSIGRPFNYCEAFQPVGVCCTEEAS